MKSSPTDDPEARLRAWAERWGVLVDQIVETTSSIIALGHRDQQPVALKIVRTSGDEWYCGVVLAAFGGDGVVRAIEQEQGAVLMERAMPGTSLARSVVNDDDATTILAGVIQRMSPAPPPRIAPTVASLAGSFERYLTAGDHRIPQALVRRAQAAYLGLCASQGAPRLLHGDLHHDNVLLDHRRGWLAIDPKGVVGEAVYEVGAALRNPANRPELFAAPTTIEQRVHRFAHVLGLDEQRILTWAFAQAVLAAVWELEDDGELTAGHGWVTLARSIGSILGAGPDA